MDVIVDLLHVAGNFSREEVERLLSKVDQKYCDLQNQINGQSLEVTDHFLNIFDSLKIQDASITWALHGLDDTADKIKRQLDGRISSVTEDVSRVNTEISRINSNLLCIEQISSLKAYLDDLEENRIDVVQRATTCKTALKLLSELISQNQTIRIIDAKNTLLIIDLKMLGMLKEEFDHQLEKLRNALLIDWRNFVKQEKSVETHAGRDRLLLKLKDEKQQKTFEQLLTACLVLNELDPKMKQLAALFVDCIIEPIAESFCECQEAAEMDYVSLSACQSNLQSTRDTLKIIDNVEQAFGIIGRFLDIDLGIQNKSLSGAQSDCDFSNVKLAFGRYACKDTIQLLTNRLLKTRLDNVSKNELKTFADNRDNFSQILAKFHSFQDHLVSMGFLDNERVPVADFSLFNVDHMFFDAKCRWVLGRTRCLLQDRNLQETVDSESAVACFGADEYGNIEQLMKNQQESYNSSLVQQDISENRKDALLESLFNFPVCKISSSVAEIVTLIFQTITEASATTTEPAIAHQLIDCAQKCFQFFQIIYLPCHKDQWMQLPLFSALVYNNCQFMAYAALMLSFRFCPKVRLFSESEPTVDYGVTFTSFVPKFKSMAIECVDRALTERRMQLTECTDQIVLSQLNDSRLKSFTCKMLKQCVMCLNSFSRTWLEVMPRDTVHNWLGHLCKSVLDSLCNKVLSMEDITAVDSNEIQTIFKQLSVDFKNLFKSDEGVLTAKYCGTSFFKFQEIIFLLGSTLQQIDERWCDGHGPLAMWLSKDDVKRLIRALFQNTDRRAQFLAKII